VLGTGFRRRNDWASASIMINEDSRIRVGLFPSILGKTPRKMVPNCAKLFWRIGSRGLCWVRGFGPLHQKLSVPPIQSTDFIFAVISPKGIRIRRIADAASFLLWFAFIGLRRVSLGGRPQQPAGASWRLGCTTLLVGQIDSHIRGERSLAHYGVRPCRWLAMGATLCWPAWSRQGLLIRCSRRSAGSQIAPRRKRRGAARDLLDRLLPYKPCPDG